MSGPPDFDALVGGDLPEAERARLRHVHEQLVAAGPPPELTPALEDVPVAATNVSFLPRRRRAALLVVAAALALAAFGVGYLVGDRNTEPSPSFAAERTVVLEEGAQVAVVRIGEADANGNRPMLVTVEGLPHLPARSYYPLSMTRDGGRAVQCGTFNVEGTDRSTVRLLVAYDPDSYDGLVLSEYRHEGHETTPLLAAEL